jgi:small-conductance mechanosensitive channel
LQDAPALKNSPKKKAPGNVLKEKPDTKMDESEEYYKSLTFSVAVIIQQVARLANIVYWFDCALIVLQVMGFLFSGIQYPSGDFAKCLFTTWGCFKLMIFKRYLLGAANNRRPDKLGQAVVCDRVMDVLIYMALGLAIMDTVNFQLGPGLASLFAFGGLGTFVFGMASRDMAAQVMSGIAVTASKKFHVGEDIQLGDSTQGIVDNMGWLYTDLRGFDEIVMKIPNNQLVNQRISNISRIDKCQVKASLRFSHYDHARIPKFCIDLKEELIKKCTELILDGSRPFRVNWRGFESDHLVVLVDTHHFIKPTGDKFWENQEVVLGIISHVAEESGIIRLQCLNMTCTVPLEMTIVPFTVKGTTLD